MKKNIKNICCIGAGYVGGPTMAVIAHKCKEIIVNVVDSNKTRIDLWNNDDLKQLPVYEPGLDKIISETRNKNLFFSTNVEKNISNADIVFISVNTPTKTKGLGAGKASDLKWVELCTRQVAKFSSGHTIVVEKSTLPVRTAEVIQKILHKAQGESKNTKNLKTFDVLSNPEFLAEGSAIKDLLEPDRVLIGGEDQISMKILSEIYENWIPQEKILLTNLWSSELAKLVANAFLAQRISSINSISALCEKTGADINQVSKAIGLDQRIGSKFLEAGPGFGGSCFQKDILNLVYLSEYFGLPEVSRYWEEVITINEWQRKRIYRSIVEKLFGTITQKKIGILGFAFKADTNDTRESSAIQIAKDLLNEGANLVIYDPKVRKNQVEAALNLESRENHLDDYSQGEWTYADNIYDVFKSSDCVVLMTEWKSFSEIDWQKAAKEMRHPAWIFDTRGVVDKKQVTESGLNFWKVGIG